MVLQLFIGCGARFVGGAPSLRAEMLSPVRPRLFGTTNLVTPLHHLCQRGVALSAKIPPKMCIPPRVPADFLPDLRIPWLVWDRMITVSRSFSKRYAE